MSPEVKCAVCGKVLTPYDTKVQDGGKSYCPVCYYQDIRDRADSGEATGRKANEVARCSACGKALAPETIRARRGEAAYCEKCHAKAGDKAEDRRFYVAERAGMITRPGVTSVRDPANLIECANCGWVITRDRLATFERDARGKLRCAHCGKRFEAPQEKAPAKPRPERMGAEDFANTAQLFKCLGDPCRVKIVESLSEKELCVFEFVDLTGFQYSAISYHLKMLKELGIVQSHERGNFMVYSLTEKGQIVHEFIRKSRELK